MRRKICKVAVLSGIWLAAGTERVTLGHLVGGLLFILRTFKNLCAMEISLASISLFVCVCFIYANRRRRTWRILCSIYFVGYLCFWLFCNWNILISMILLFVCFIKMDYLDMFLNLLSNTLHTFVRGLVEMRYLRNYIF